MSDWTIFGERLSHIMREYDVSLRELSRRTGITLTTLHRYATSKRVPRATEILKCANALGITIDYLLGLSNDPHLTGKGERIIGKGESMNDLISRQAAIEETWKEPSYTDPLNVLTELRDRIKDLPSAQPEQRWIPCSERLPEHPQPNTDFDGKQLAVYLVCRKGYIPFSAFWNGEFFSDDWTPIEVDAWMALPEPYKEDDHD